MRWTIAAATAVCALLAAGPDPGTPEGLGPALSGASAAPTTSTAYAPPADGPVLRLFDPPAVPWGRGHRGVDLGTQGLVRSPGPGVVTFSGPVAGRGVVTVTHPDGLRSSLEPVEEAPEAGTVVRTGDPVGQAVPGHCADLCVHWGVRRGEQYVDPLSLLGDATVVLLE